MTDVRLLVDLLWIVLSATLVFLMQAGFLTLETGLTRSKNNINVAIKNLADFGVSTFLYWIFGFALMFGITSRGLFGTSGFLLPFELEAPRLMAFFLFQVMFCGTAVTIVSGAVAERLRTGSYILIAALISGLTYPIFGHWAWNGANTGQATGWLVSLGFVDFAGSTVVHSVGAWSALAVLLVIGARTGRFPTDGPPRKIPGANLPLAALGVLLLYVGWIGFNGGSTLALNEQAILAVTNTILAGSAGLLSATIVGYLLYHRADVGYVMNGTLAGLVAITANAHAVTAVSAAIIGAVGGLVMIGVEHLLEQYRIDDAVGAIPVHLGAGIWGTLAVGIFGRQALLGTGLSRPAQIGVQLLGIVVCFLWVFVVTSIIVRFINRIKPMRVTPEQERIGLNISEHGASTELVDLFMVMDTQAKTGDLSLRVPVEPFTEVGQIAERYNQMMDSLEGAIARTQIIVRSAMDAIITLSKRSLSVSTVNPAAEAMFGYQHTAITGQPVTRVLYSHQSQNDTVPSTPAQLRTWLARAAVSGHPQEIVGERADGSKFPIEATVAEVVFGDEPVYVGTMHDITARKQAEAELSEYRKHLEDQVASRTFELTQTNQRLEQAKDEAEAANRAKSAFMLNISHELVTPMNAILGYSEMLIEDAEGEGLDEMVADLEKITTSGLRLLSLINDVLDISEIDTGHMDLSLERFDLTPILNETVLTIAPAITKNGNELVAEFDLELGSMLADLAKVRQVLLNLLSNAAKFTKEGTITLAAGRESRQDGDWIIMRVSDTGIGIPEDKLDYVFEMFTQADESTTRIYGGTGLGLAISRHFCRMMGGDILVKTQVSVGSTFTVELPAEVKVGTATKDMS